MSNFAELDPEHTQVLWVCHECCQSFADPNGSFCYRWIIGKYQERFGVTFHQSKLTRLARVGLLRQDDLRRGGSRRYYSLNDPALVGSLLQGWKLD